MKIIMPFALVAAAISAQTLPIANSDGATFRTALNNALATMKTNIDGKVPATRTVAGHALSADVTLVKADVGLGNVDNTSDANKPVSTAQQTALDLKANTADLATVATTGDYADLSGTPSLATVATTGAYGDLSGTPTLDKAAVGLANVDNTSDASKPVSTATQTALDAKQDAISGAPGTWPSFATVATSGSYTDLTSKPTTSIEIGLAFGAGNATASSIAIGDKPLPPRTLASARTMTACYVVCQSAPVGSAATTRILKNGSDSGVTVSCNAAATSGSATGLSVSFAAGDTFGGDITSAGSTTAAKGVGVTCLFQ